MTKEDRTTHRREAEIDAVDCKRLSVKTHRSDVLNHLQQMSNYHHGSELTAVAYMESGSDEDEFARSEAIHQQELERIRRRPFHYESTGPPMNQAIFTSLN